MVTSYKTKSSSVTSSIDELDRNTIITIRISGEQSPYEYYRIAEMFEGDLDPEKQINYYNIEKPPHCLVWSNLSLKLVKEQTLLLDGLSGSARAGRVLALMGPSGAGKTTLLNALGNRAPYGIVTGEITFGQRPFVTSDLYFVPQVDEVNSNLTVQEQIELVGLLKCRNRRDMYIRLEIVINVLGLHDKAQRLCRDLTGGELKKVSVGMGMISKPNVLFLDEPTTGLDSTAAYYIVKHLVELAGSLNIAVILTIHQPAEMVLDLLQDLYLLGNGRMVYTGPLSCSERYLHNIGYLRCDGVGFTDFLLDLVCKPPSRHPESSWQKLYLESKFCINYAKEQGALNLAVAPALSASPAPPVSRRLYQILVFFVKYYSRDPGFYLRRILSLIVIAFFSGTLFLNLRPETVYISRYSGAAFFNIWAVLFSAVAATGRLAKDRRQAVEQVKNAVVCPALYCFAQLMVSLPFNFIAALIFQSVFHWLSRINPNWESFLYAVLITWGHLLLMEAYMLSAVEVLENAMLCVTFAMIILGYLFLFAGFFVKIEEMPRWISWISYLAPTKYSFNGYLQVVFKYQTFLVSGSSPRTYISGDDLLNSQFNRRDCRAWEMFGVLLAWIVVVRLLHYGIFTYHVLPFLPSREEYSIPVFEEEGKSSLNETYNLGLSPDALDDDERDTEIGASRRAEVVSFEEEIHITSDGKLQWR